MGTTAEKLAYLKESKEQIKNVLETPYNVMRDYPALIKKYIDNQPTNIVMDGNCVNALDVPVKEIDIDGNSEQQTYSGKNKLNVEENLTFTTTKTIEVNIPAGTYKVSFLNETHGESDNPTMRFYTNGNWIILNFTGGETSITLEQDETKIILYSNGYDYNASEGIEATIKQLMISVDGGEYEPYVGGQPSPNPEYKQDVEVIDGLNEFDKDKIEIGKTWNNTSNTDRAINFIKVEPNTTYTISCEDWKDLFCSLFCLTEKGATTYEKSTDWFNSDTYTITTTESTKTLGMHFKYTSAGNIVMTKEMFNDVKIELVEGTTPKSYLPYVHIGLRQTGKNFIAYPYKDTSLTMNGITFTDNGDGTITINGTATALAFFRLSNNIDYGLAISGWNSGTNGTYAIPITSNTEPFMNYNANNKILSINVNEGITVDNYTFKPILVEGTSVTQNDFEPYHEPILYPINLNGNSISKVGDTPDKLKIYRNGNVEIEKNINEVVLDGTEDWYRRWASETQNIFGCLNFLPDSLRFENKTNNIICISSHFVATHYDGGTGSIWDYRNNDNHPYLITIIDSSGNPNVGEIVIKHKDITTVDELKTFLQEQYANGTPVTVKYQLATPQTIQLASIEPIVLWKGTNKFELITNLDTTFTTEYIINKNK